MSRTSRDDKDYDVSAPRSAGLIVEVFPIGEPGKVGLAVHNAGPERLTQDEAVALLLQAAASLDASATWPGRLPGE